MLEIKENELLKNHSTFKIGGLARYFYVAKNKEEIMSAIKWAHKNELPFFILAGGSNILFSDKGFDGLVIKILNTQYIIHDTKIIADAGVNLGKLVIESINNGLTGLEWAIGIPGTIGGAVFGNAGAYGYSISESVEKIKTLVFSSLRVPLSGTKQSQGITAGSPRSLRSLAMTERKYNNKKCEFGYRESVFKRNNEIILEVSLKLEKGDKEKSRQKIKEAIFDRRKKTPPYPSTGCYFKNYVLQKENDTLIKNFPELVSKVKGGKIGVGYLIDKCGLKGKQINNAKISEEHANFIVNLGGATAKDVFALADLCKQKVFEKYRIKLEEETRLIGFE